MNISEKIQFRSAYLNTNYIVQLKEKQIIIRIGEINKSLDRLLNDRQSRCWAFITAYNPFSKSLTDEENEIRQEKLLHKLKSMNLQFLEGFGQSENGDWAAEPSVFIFDISRKTAIEIGKVFEQNAIVFGRLNEAPKLVWC